MRRALPPHAGTLPRHLRQPDLRTFGQQRRKGQEAVPESAADEK